METTEFSLILEDFGVGKDLEMLSPRIYSGSASALDKALVVRAGDTIYCLDWV